MSTKFFEFMWYKHKQEESIRLLRCSSVKCSVVFSLSLNLLRLEGQISLCVESQNSDWLQNWIRKAHWHCHMNKNAPNLHLVSTIVNCGPLWVMRKWMTHLQRRQNLESFLELYLWAKDIMGLSESGVLKRKAININEVLILHSSHSKADLIVNLRFSHDQVIEHKMTALNNKYP